MSSESDIILQYDDTKIRLDSLRADYDAIFGIANTPEEFVTLNVIQDQIRAEERAMKDIKAKLPARESLGAKYSVEILGFHEILFVIPPNVPRIRIIEEAQAIYSKLDKRNYVFPNRYKVWLDMPSFTEGKPTEVRIAIDGCVDESQNRTLADQKLFLRRKFEEGEASLPTIEDLAVAHALFFIVTRQNLFRGYKIRALNGSLFFDNLGLGMDRFSLDWNRFSDVGAACYLPSGTIELMRNGKKIARGL
ncbi:MAG: hypothetical protein EXS25_02450 [Pedosphaera sp.]|nr:hypothetical protein [Pedosphaera sp.]